MRSLLIAFAGLMLITTAAQAKVEITVDKNNQLMTVAVDGVERYQWPVSTGNPSHETPNGTFQTFRMDANHFSKEFDDAPMPHAIFFTKLGHAIHGTESEGKLGIPVSHGCVRISRAHATTLYDLVEKEGVLNTSVTLTGSSQIAIARLGRNRTAVARNDIDDGQGSDTAGQPVALTPRQAQGQYASGQYAQGRYAQGQYAQRSDDGYIYPADGSDDGARYPAPPSARRMYDAQAYPAQQQPSYNYNNPQYAPPAYQQPQPYYQQRGFFN
jgi:L,D-transpeptidase catalytic domain